MSTQIRYVYTHIIYVDMYAETHWIHWIINGIVHLSATDFAVAIEAIEIYQQAANQYKMAKMWQEALAKSRSCFNMGYPTWGCHEI